MKKQMGGATRHNRLNYLLLVGMILTGCSNGVAPSQTGATPQAASPSQSSSQAEACPPAPDDALKPGKAEDLVLDASPKEVSGMANSSQYVSYRFTAKAKQKLLYSPNEQNLCVWVYAPNLQIVKGAELSVDGTYVVQVAALKGSQTFNLNLSLLEENQPVPSLSTSRGDVESSISSTFSKSDFPKASCGDPMPSDPKAYPVSFYPVNLPNTESNLNQARSQFCGDAYVKRSKDTGEMMVQVVSFMSKEKAEDFAALIRADISGASVGSPTVKQWSNGE
jgi:hypothetical protein